MDINNQIALASKALLQGELVAFPTETVYGLGADATNDAAVAKLYAAKGRPSFNPLISHVANKGAAFALGEFSAEAKGVAETFWPGPMTVVVPRRSGCPVSLLASSGLPSIALRVPANDLALQLLKEVGVPVVAPSANRSGRISPTTAAHVRDGFGDELAMIIDGGRCSVGVESTVVSFMGNRPVVLRHGGLARDALEQHLGYAMETLDNSTRPHSPGQMASHYAPRALMRLNVIDPEVDETYLGFGDFSHGPYSLSVTGDVTEAAAKLFRLLHQIDATEAAKIAVAPIPDHGLGEAINDRLTRAAAPRPA